jgi:hypothetical protein
VKPEYKGYSSQSLTTVKADFSLGQNERFVENIKCAIYIYHSICKTLEGVHGQVVKIVDLKPFASHH